MTEWVLERQFQLKHAMTGEKIEQTSFHVGFCLGFPEGSSLLDNAMKFKTRKAARDYAKLKLVGRGYKAVRF